MQDVKITNSANDNVLPFNNLSDCELNHLLSNNKWAEFVLI